MSRYQSVKTKRGTNNKTMLKTVLYPDIARTSEDLWVITDSSDRLDLLAYQYYGSAQYWWVLAQANNIGKGTLAIEPGTQLRIPADLAGILEQQRHNNSN